MEVITVTRGYIHSFAVPPPGAHVGKVLTGATGCGKSTFGILQLLMTVASATHPLKFLMIQPTRPNVGNVMRDFHHVLPPIVARDYPHLRRFPRPEVLAYGGRVHPGRFYVTDAETACKIVLSQDTERRVEFDVVMLDECHLTDVHVMTMAFYLRLNRRSSRLYILSSATPEGKAVYVGPSPTLQVQKGHAPFLPLIAKPTRLPGSVYDPTKYFDWGNGKVAIFLPDDRVMSIYCSFLKAAGVPFSALTKNTSVARYLEVMALLTQPEPRVVVILPELEAGITVDCSVFLDPGLTKGLQFRDSVLYSTSYSTTGAEATQRQGRAGRNYMATIIHNTADEGGDRTSARTYYEAVALVRLAARGTDIAKAETDAFDAYPVLRTVTKEAAKAAVSERGMSPLLALSMFASNGERYRECGGSESGFIDTWTESLKVFKWSRGYVVAPFFDLVDPDFDPSGLIVSTSMRAVLVAMVNHHRAGAPIVQDNTNKMADNIEMFAEVLESTFRAVCDYKTKRMWSHDIDGVRSPVPISGIFQVANLDVGVIIDRLSHLPGYDLVPEFDRVKRPRSVAYRLDTPTEAIYLNPSSEYLLADGSTLDATKFATKLTDLCADYLSVCTLLDYRGAVSDLDRLIDKASPYHRFINNYVRAAQPLKVGLQDDESADAEERRMHEAYSADIVSVEYPLPFDEIYRYTIPAKAAVPSLQRSNPWYTVLAQLRQAVLRPTSYYDDKEFSAKDVSKLLRVCSAIASGVATIRERSRAATPPGTHPVEETSQPPATS
jgi:hypothetical protein